MTDHHLFIPTAGGPVGATMSLPSGSPDAGVMIFHGRGGRSGLNQIWVRAGRSLAEAGLAALRVDYPGGTDSSLATARHPEAIHIEAAGWFRRHIGNRPLLLVGRCGGARSATYLASRVDGVAGVGLVIPHLWRSGKRTGPLVRPMVRIRRAFRLVRGRRGKPDLDRPSMRYLQQATERCPVWALSGERDVARVALQELQAYGIPLELELLPGSLRGHPDPESQLANIERIVRWAQRTVAPATAASG
jgi:hypothetical protein